MAEPVTIGEILDQARNGEEFGAALMGLFRVLEQKMDEEDQSS